MTKIYLLFFTCLVITLSIAYADDLSYSGRLVNTDSSPVTGPVDLRFHISYSGTPTTVLCTKDVTSVPLNHGVFHVSLDFDSSDCSPTKPFVDILNDLPSSESVLVQITDVTNSRTYPHQALKSVPFSIQANIAKNIHTTTAPAEGQVLKWVSGKWTPSAAGGSGSITEIQTGSGLVGGPINSSGTISIASGGVTTSHIADSTITDTDISTTAGIGRHKIASGTANHVLINNGSGAFSSVAQLPLTLGGTGAANASDARLNLGLGDAATRNVGLNNGNILLADEVPSCLAHQKIQKTAVAPYIFSCANDNDSADASKLPLLGGTMLGAINMGGFAITNLLDPVNAQDAATRNYVHTYVASELLGVSESQWIDSGSDIYFSAGNVGIGKSTPSKLLDVNGDILVNGVTIGRGGGNDSLNTAIGFNALNSNTANYNSAFGYMASASNTSGSSNTSVGFGALSGITVGSYNTAIGRDSGLYIADGATANQTSSSSVYIGSFTKALVDGGTNEIVIGYNTIGNGSNSATLGNDLITKTILKGNVGIGTNNPGAKLEVAGQVRISGGTPGAGKVLTSDATGLATWESPAAGGISALTGDVTASGSGSVAATIANDAITTAKILDGTIVNADIANSSITYSKLNIADGSIPIAKLIRMTCLPGEVITSDAALGFRCVTDNTTDTTKLPLAGGTMTGAITLAANPTANLHAATKQYVDARATQWLTSGSNIYYNAGNVGIGTSSPSGKLHLESASDTQIIVSTTNAANSSQIEFRRAAETSWFGPTASSFDIWFGEANPILFGIDGNERMRITAAGDVGIGTTNPTAKLHVAGQVRITGGVPGLGKVLTSDATGLATWQSSPTGDLRSDGTVPMTGAFQLANGTAAAPSLTFAINPNTGFYRPATNAIGISLGGAERVRFDHQTTFNHGMMGINTNPARTFHVSQNSVSGVIAQFDTPSGSAIELRKTSTPASVYLTQETDNGFFIDSSIVTTTPSFYISSARNIGLGTKTPGAKLEVVGQVKITGGTPAAGKVLTSDATGLATWETPGAGGITALTGDVTASGSGSVAATIANNAITSAKILDGTIVNEDIANGIITYGKLNLDDEILPIAKLARLNCSAGQVLTSDAFVGYRCVNDSTTDSTKLPLAGGTMTGAITLAANPTNNLHAASKQYVDSAVSTNASKWITSGSDIYSNNSGNVGIGVTTPSAKLNVRASSTVSTGIARVLTLERDSTVATGSGFGSELVFAGKTTTTSSMDMARIQTWWNSATNGSQTSTMTFSTAGGGVLVERMRFTNIGWISLGGGLPSAAVHITQTPSTVIQTGPSTYGKTFLLGTASIRDSATAASGTAAANALNSILTANLEATNTNVTTTNAYNLFLEGAPIKGTNNTAMNAIALGVGSTNVGTHINSFGLVVNAQSGATNNHAAAFMGGNVGIGTTNPDTSLHIAGQIKITGGFPGAGKVLTSDGTGLATWQTPSTSSSSVGMSMGNMVILAGLAMTRSTNTGACTITSISGTSVGKTHTLTMPSITTTCPLPATIDGLPVKIPTGYVSGNTVAGVVYTLTNDGSNVWISHVEF